MKMQLYLGILAVLLSVTDAVHKFNVGPLGKKLKAEPKISTREEICSAIGLHGNNAIVPRQSLETVDGHVKERLEQTYGGLEVVGGGITAEVTSDNGYTGKVNGDIYTGIEKDIPDPEACSHDDNIVADVAFQDAGTTEDLATNLKVTRNIFVKGGRAYLTYEIVFFFMDDDIPRRPCYFIDACALSVLYKFENIQHVSMEKLKTLLNTKLQEKDLSSLQRKAVGSSDCFLKGVGGNKKIGEIEYGTSPFCLSVTVKDSMCVLENEHVKVVDMQQLKNKRGRSAVEFSCSNGYDDAINGAHSPVLDAMFYGTSAVSMFKNWYDVNPLNFKPTLYVHFGSRYENAFWDGRSLTFGDGRNYFYPLVCQDVLAHELAHGLTTSTSNLLYDGQSGGIDEAFSDITGEVAEMFAKGSNDWEVGADIFKWKAALRYFDDPTKDGWGSIKHIADYEDHMDVHFTSGIFNHAFYQMVKENGMPMRDAYECLLRANRLYWGRRTTFMEGACDVMRACEDLGFNTGVVVKSFKVVGIDLRNCD